MSLVRTVLSQMRFSFVPGDEAMYPVGDNHWLRLKMSETPLVETPWGTKLILNPVPQDDHWYSQIKSLGFQVCNVGPALTLSEVFKALTQNAPGNFRLWESGRDLTFGRNSLTFSLNTPQTVVITKGESKQIYVIWFRKTIDEPPLPQALPEILESAQIKVIEFDAFNELSRLPHMPKQSIYMPTASALEIVRAMNPTDPEAIFGKVVPTDLRDLLYLLKSKGLLQQGAASMVWARGIDRKLSIQVPAWIVQGPNKIVLLQRAQADEYLVSLLSHEGYSCFILPE